jgi:uncharacterized protein (DUF58 family)
MFFGSQENTKSVVAAKLAALSAFRVLKEGDRVGGIVFADNGVDIVYPKRDRRNILRFLEKIVERNHELEHSDPVQFKSALKEVFARIINIVTHDFLIVIVSDFMRYSPEVIKFMTRLSYHNDVIAIKVFDPMERDMPATKLVAGDKTSQIVVDGSNKLIRNKFSEGFDADYKNFESSMKKAKIPLFKIDTISPVDRQIKEILTGKAGRK